jgi:oligopeptide transport system substrate-binding protein
MRGRTRAMVAVAFTSIALVATACGGGGGGETPAPGASGGGQAGGEITIKGCTPQNPLTPANTSEVCGGDVLDAVMAKLVAYNPDTSAPEMDIAQSIETSDNQSFTVKLKPDYKFQDGTVVKAKNFVDAWNYASYAPNGQEGGYFFEPFEGWDAMQCGNNAKDEPDCDAKPPKAKTLTGLKVVDDTTFTIKTTAPVSNLPVRLGYTAFAPLPDSFFKDPKAFANKPIGAGPFSFDSKDTTKMVLTKFADYSGSKPANVDKVTFRIYTDDGAAYNDVVANNLDYTNTIPADRLTGDLYKTELPDRNSNTPSGTIQALDFSPVDEQLQKSVELRKSISMAIDRDLINKQIFNGTRPPLDGWVSPVVDGFKAGACGDACKFDPTKAKQMYEAAGGYKGTLTLAVNGDGGHKPWADAACNSIKNTLGVDCQTKVTPDFATLLNQLRARELKGTFRAGWQMDYPSIENFLTPIYAKGAGSNYTNYNNPDFEAKLKEAAAAKTPDESNKLYQEAEGFLAKDFPAAPMWSYAITVGWSEKVTDVKITPFGRIDLSAIKLK